MRKKMITRLTVFLAIMMAFALLAGCRGGVATMDPTPAEIHEPVKEEPKDDPAPAPTPEPEAESDLAYIMSKGAIKIGITLFQPMNYEDDSGKLIGFDTEFAEELCSRLGVTPDFIIINWDTKEIELAAKNIDCIWNGLTVTEERRENMEFTTSYIKNMQVAVIRAADKDKFTSLDSLADAKLCAESGSAGETAIQDEPKLADAKYTGMKKQTDALLEVKSGRSDVAVLDYTLAKSMVGEGTSYKDLMILSGVELEVEEYAIGFRVGSDAVPEVNKIIDQMIADGTLAAIAAKPEYDLLASLLSEQN